MFNYDQLSDLHNHFEFVAYAIKDGESDSFALPSFYRSPYDACRNFESAIVSQFATQSGVLFSHFREFALFAIGGFNSDCGHLIPTDEPCLVRTGVSVVREFNLADDVESDVGYSD